MITQVDRALRPFTGAFRVPGDKSISHRVLLLAAMAEGASNLSGVLDSSDVRASATAIEELGARISFNEPDEWGMSIRVVGWGARGPKQPEWLIDCHNSGTTARLLMGVLAGWPVKVTLTGDRSLTKRPMRRVVDPLSRMGATFDVDVQGTLPVTVHGTDHLQPLSYASPIASAQVKTACLLAGLRAHGRTRITEPTKSRDHTERLLPIFGIDVILDDGPGVSVEGPAIPKSADVLVPGDPSSAAFLAVAALLVPGSAIEVSHLSLNPSRLGFARVLQRMGALVEMSPVDGTAGEPVGVITAEYSPVMSATCVTADEVPELVDEVPILALAASQANGTTRFEGVGELRVKESDRLAAIADGLSSFGVTVRFGHDWLEVDGPARLRAAHVDSLGDHRLAMTYAVAGLIADGPSVIERFEAVDVSFPSFGGFIAPLLTSDAQ